MNEPFHCISCNSVDIPLDEHGRCSRCGSEAVVSAHVVEAPPAVEESTSDIRPKTDFRIEVPANGETIVWLETPGKEPEVFSHCGCGFFHTREERCGPF